MKRRYKDVAILPLVIALLLCLVFPSLGWADPAKQKITICHMPGTPAQITLEVPSNALSGHLAHGDVVGSCTHLPPGGTPLQPETADGVSTICHKPGTPAEKTMAVTAADLDSHLAHGDLLGPCAELPSPAAQKVLICHKPRTAAQKTMTVPSEALVAHLDHGDVLGSCQDLLGVAGSRRPVIASYGVSMATWRVRGSQRPYAY
jgi:hypothetical protein